MPTAATARANKRIWGFISIGSSSAVTLVLTAVAARVGGTQMLGEVAACLSGYVVGAAVCRALVPDVAIVTARADDASGDLHAREGATLIVLGAALPLIFLVVVLQAQVTVGTTLLLTLLISGPVLQDSVRFLLIAQDLYRLAAVTDIGVLLTIAAILVVPVLAGRSMSLVFVMLVWSAVTLGMAAWVLLRSGALPSIRGGVSFLAANRRLGMGFLTDSGLTMLGSQTVLSLVSGLAGVPALGAWRAAQSVVGPFGTVFQAIQPLAIRHVSVTGAARGSLRRLGLISAILGAAAVLAAQLFVTVLAPLGEALFAHAWIDVRPVVFPVTLYLLGSWLTLVPVVFFRSTRRAATLAALRTLVVLVQIATAAGAFALINDFASACYVVASAQLFSAAAWWAAMYITNRRAVRSFPL